MSENQPSSTEKANFELTGARKALLAVISAYIYLIILIGLLLALLSQVICWVLCFPIFIFKKRARYITCGLCLRLWTAASAFIFNPFWKLEVIDQAPKNFDPKKLILMCNHMSALDPFILARGWLPYESKYVFKSSLLKIPVCGWVLYLAGDIPIYFKFKEGQNSLVRPGSVPGLMSRVKYYQDMGIPVFAFPEGGRSPTGHLQLFKTGFFRYAVENDCQILPCVIYNSNKLWPFKSALLRPGTTYLCYGDLMEVKDLVSQGPAHQLQKEKIDFVKTTIRETMIGLLKKCEEESTRARQFSSLPILQY